MKRRLLALTLVLAMAVGLAAPALASGEEADVDVEAANVTVEGNDDVGALLANEMTEAMDQSGGGNYISDLVVEGIMATVSFLTDRPADVVVAIYDEDTQQMITSGSARVTPDMGTVYIRLSSHPKTFLASAFLLDANGHGPLCEEFRTTLYTKSMQEFLQTTIRDYRGRDVLNLDGQSDTNFMVYSEGTVVVKENRWDNFLTDNGDGAYTITNATSSVTAMQPGDVLSYTYSDGTILLVKVADIKVDGTTVTITEDKDIELQDAFDYIKIESGQGDWAAPASLVDEQDAFTKRVPIDESTNAGGVSFKLSGALTAVFHYKLYYAFWQQSYYIGFQIDLSAELHGSIAAATGRQAIDLTVIDFDALQILHFRLTPRFVYEASGKLSYDAVLTAAVGYGCDNGSFINRSSKPKLDVQMKIEAELYVGLELEAKMYVLGLDGDLYASLTAEAGGQVRGTMLMTNQQAPEERHSCRACIDGAITGRVSVTGKAKFLNLWSYDKRFFDFNKKITDFYYSFDYDEFGWTTCPHREYKVLLTVTDENGKPLSGVSVEAKGLGQPVVTDDKGQTVFFLRNGKYELVICYNDLLTEEEIVVTGKPQTISTTLDTSAVAGIVASGSCGDDLRWSLTDSGVLTVTGTGAMNDYQHGWDGDVSKGDGTWYDNRPWSTRASSIVAIVIGEGVTSVGDQAFNTVSYSGVNEQTSLRRVTLPSSLVSIGDEAFDDNDKLVSVEIKGNLQSVGERAFMNCRALSHISLTNCLTEIGSGAFSGCSSLRDVNIPSGVKVIEQSVFAGCSSLAAVSIPESVTEIRYYAFSGCNGLKDVYYEGDETQWGAISIGYDNEYLTGAQIHYNSTGPADAALAMEPAETVPPEATAEPAPEVTEEPTPEATAEPTPEATAEPTPETTAEPTPEATAEPTPEATAEPTPETTAEPTPEVTEEPTPEATAEPTPEATAEPTPEPTPEPTAEPVPELPEQTAQTGILPTRATQQRQTGQVVLVSAFDGVTDGYTASFNGLEPGKDYVILVVQSLDEATLLKPGNLQYIAQMQANANGGINLEYIPVYGNNYVSVYVRAYGPPEFDLGDTDHDGAVTLKDVTRLYQYVSAQIGVTVERETGDVTGDGKINERDMKRLFQYVSGQIDVMA